MPILISLLLTLLVGCQSSHRRQNEFNSIEMGMRKRDVLNIAGNPRHTDRKSGTDRWYYYLIQDDPESQRVIHFKNSKVIYKGQRTEPRLTAEEADSIKAPRDTKIQPYIRSLSDKELKDLIKKDLRKKTKKKIKPRFEEI